MNSIVLKRLKQRPVNLGENQSAAQAVTGESKPTTALLDAEIVSNACEGVLLRYRTADGSLNRVAYQRSVVEAERAAQAEFGIRHDEWQAGNLPAVPPRKPTPGRPQLPRRR
jgi:hypothetical protein